MMQTYNFSAGPAMLPADVLQQAQQELIDWRGLGASVMEMSHRGEAFMQVAHEAEADLRTLLAIPQHYKVLFCHGGARAQFAAVPGNLLGQQQHADYIDAGYWAHSAFEEAKKYCLPRAINVLTHHDGKKAVLPMHTWQLNEDAAYVHYCPNETIDGIAIDEQPNFVDHTVVADFSSTLLSRPIDVSQYGVIYAGAQKNIGPAGLAIVIVREDLLGRTRRDVPSILDYQVAADNGSMFNTPPTFAWYLAGLVFKWLIKQGGLRAIEKINQQKAALLYQTIDSNPFWYNDVAPDNRSRMNVPFWLADAALEKTFVQSAQAAGLLALKGHRAVGGIRASIYNAMPLAGVVALTQFMQDFARRYG